MRTIEYRPEVDGLRALAVLAVVVFHLDGSWLPGGYLGVDVFFVISGFLITALIQGSRAAGDFSYAAFYLRRVRRLFPAMALVLAVCLAYGIAVYPPWTLRSMGAQVISVLGFVANLKMRAFAGDYWGERAQDLPLLHTWSLAVEEQFYLAYPFVLLAVLHRVRTRPGRLLAGSLALLGSLGICWHWSVRDPDAAFYLLPARAWELLAGCLLAVAQSGRPQAGSPRARRWAAVAGIVLIGAPLVVPASSATTLMLARLSAVAGAVLYLGSAGGSGGRVERFFAGAPVVLVGRMSYSLYLWHWPVIVACRQWAESPVAGFDPRWVVPVAVGLMTALSAVSYFVVERTTRPWRFTPVASAGVAVVLVLVSLGVRRMPASGDAATGRADGAATWAAKAGLVPPRIRGMRYVVNPAMSKTEGFRRKYANVPVDYPAVPSPVDRGFERGDVEHGVDVLVFGDSHAMVAAGVLDELMASNRLSGKFMIAEAMGITLFRKAHGDGSTMTAAEIDLFDRRRREALERHPKVCLVVSRYSGGEFEEARETLDLIARNSHLVMVQQAPVLNVGDECTYDVFGEYWRRTGSFGRLNIREPRGETRSRRRFEAQLKAHFAGNPNFTFFETEQEFLEPDGRIRWWDGKSTLYYLDDDHLTDEGIRRYAGRLARTLVERARPR